MSHYTYSILMAGGLFIGVLLCIEAGRRIGISRKRQGHDPAKAGTGTVDAAVFGLLGLLIAFTFSGAASRFDTRRMQIVEEANAIGTAFLRVDLLPAETQPEIRALFRSYVDGRLAAYRAVPDMSLVRRKLVEVQDAQNKLWSACVAACAKSPTPAATTLMIPALNELFDLATVRTAMTEMHVPAIVVATLFIIAMGSALLAGFGMSAASDRNLLHFLGFALLIAFVVYVILDMEFPRLGMLRVDAFDSYLEAARAAMK